MQQNLRDSATSQVRPSPVGGAGTTGRALRKMKRVLEAKRSQHRKMEQWSHLRFVRRLISRAYLDELASEISRLEAVTAKREQEMGGPQDVGGVPPEAVSGLASITLRQGKPV